MATKKQNTSKKASSSKKADAGVKDNIWGVIFIALGVFFFAAIQLNAAGELGNVLGDFFRGIFGLVAFVFPWYLIFFGILLFMNKTVHISPWSTSLAFVVLLMLSIINSGRFVDSGNIYWDFPQFYTDGVNLNGGGLFPMPLAMLLVKYLGKVGLYSVATVIIVISLLLIINTPVSQGLMALKEKREEKRRDKERWEEEQEKLAIEREKERLRREREKDKEFKQKKEMAKLGLLNESKSEIKINTQDSLIESQHNKDIENQPTDKKKADKIFSLLKDPNLFTKNKEKKEDVESISPSKKEKTFGLDGKTTFANNLEKEKEHSIEIKSMSYGTGDLDGLPNVVGDGVQTDKPETLITTTFDDNKKSLGLEEPIKVKEGYGLDSKKKSGLISALPMNKEKNKPSPEFSKEIDELKDGENREEVKKLSKKEAENLNLSKDDFNKIKIPKKYKIPPLSLLNKPVNSSSGNQADILKEKAYTLEKTLQNFNVDARVIQVTQGPAVTRYEIQPNVGVKVNSIVRLSNDIALNLRAKSIRIEAPIPGKAAVGIEVENEKINMVTLREIIGSNEFQQAESKISFAVGRDITGKAIVGDLKSMPHLLIAGSTGSGKSVCINSIITSILYKAKPEEVKLVLVDPKVVELGNYNGIPHLLVPVVTDPNKAAATLNWAVTEMTKRYKLFAETAVKDLSSYNAHLKEKGEEEKVLPQVVIVIDELADLMMAAPSQVEESICRLAQMARAAGMHLIVATQRPSVDVITGVIKANIPSRIAFAVSSQVDSRTILDMAGAEKLVGKGDMLFSPVGMGHPIRVQGCFLSDTEVNSVIDFVKKQGEEVEYSEEVMDTIETTGSFSGDDGDELLQDAIRCVVEAGQASVSMLQRRFRIGYNRAARIMDMMEERNIVGMQDGSRPRTVLMTKEELENIESEGEYI